MGLMDKLGKGLKMVGGVSGMPSMKEPSSLGKLRVGTKESFDLPAGEVGVWYQIPRIEIFSEDDDGPIIVEPGDLVVSLTPAGGGEALAVDRGSGRSHSSQDLKHQRCKIGTVIVHTAGSYSVESSSAEAPGAAELLLDG
jgi:hypothetical protein